MTAIERFVDFHDRLGAQEQFAESGRDDVRVQLFTDHIGYVNVILGDLRLVKDCIEWLRLSQMRRGQLPRRPHQESQRGRQ